MSRAVGAGLTLCAVACAEPRVETNAAWIESDATGRHAQLNVYSAGDRSVWALPTQDPVEDVLLEFDPLGRTLIAGGLMDSVHVDLARHTSTLLSAPAVAEASEGNDYLVPTYWFPRNGDALAVKPHKGQPRHLLLRLDDTGLGESLVIDPKPMDPSPVHWSAPFSAAAAPIVVYTGVESEGSVAPRGPAQALRYGPTGVELLGRGEGLRGRTIDFPPWLIWCTRGVCLDPTGQSLVYLAEEPCTLERWQWKATGLPSGVVERFAMPFSCELDIRPIAALSPDHVLIGALDHYHLVDLDGLRVSSLPRIGSEHALHVVDRGKVAVLVSTTGPVLRFSVGEARVLSARIVHCPVPQPAVVSPQGTWVAWTCVSDPIFRTEQGIAATLIRVSAFGLEVFSSLPMKPLAIDDLGNTLLYSGDITQFGAPRGLYVFTGDGQLARIDPLEPSPSPVLRFGTDLYFAAASIQ